MQNKRFRSLFILLSPTVMSGIIGSALVLLVFMFTSWNVLANNEVISSVFGGTPDAVASIISTDSTADALSTAVFSNPILNRILFFIFWSILGLIVYLFLSFAQAGITEAVETNQTSKYVNASPKQIKREYIQKIVIRALVAALWILFTIFFLRLIMPFTIACFTILGDGFTQLNGIFYGVLGAVALGVGLHIHVILLRLFFLRLRLFGSDIELS